MMSRQNITSFHNKLRPQRPHNQLFPKQINPGLPSLPRLHQSLPSLFVTNTMPIQHERDVNLSNDPLLHVNISPFLTSVNFPSVLEHLRFSPSSPPNNHEEVHTPHEMIPPLSLELCDPALESLSMLTSWAEGVLDHDSSASSINNIHHSSSFTTDVDILGERIYDPGHAYLPQENLLPYTARTPTETRRGFPQYIDHQRNGQEISPFKESYSSLSPTTIEKKIIVTDQDLKVFGSPRQCRASKVRSMGSENGWDEFMTQRNLYRYECKQLHSHRPPCDQSAQTQKDWLDSQTMHLTGKRRLVKGEKTRKKLRSESNTYVLKQSLTSLFPLEHADGLVNRARFEYTNRPVVPRMIGIYLPAARRQRIQRWLEKRKHRVYHKRINYACRKRLATTCPRFKGRFVKKSLYAPTPSSIPIVPNVDEEDTNKYLRHSSTEDEEGESEINVKIERS